MNSPIRRHPPLDSGAVGVEGYLRDFLPPALLSVLVSYPLWYADVPLFQLA